MSNYAVELAQKLMQKKSVTPENDGAIEFLAEELKGLGFKTEILKYSDQGSPEVSNLYAKYGESDKNLAFAGHTDVVPAGDESKWTHPPFASEIADNKLYGRGAVDMKAAIACYIAATKEFLNDNQDFKDSLSFIITGDEEGVAINGTVKMVEELKNRQEKISHCIVGEPTNPTKIGEMLKVGRRGSVNFTIKVIGTQGHVAYPENANNPITSLVKLLNFLIDYPYDEGNEYFDPTNLEVTSIDVANPTTNVIPETASAKFNIRFNSEYQSQDIIEMITMACDKVLGKYEIEHRVSGESFINEDEEIKTIMVNSVKEVTGSEPKLSTTGGTSDARFIKDICPCIECGLINKTAHQIDENIALDDLIKLKDIYRKTIENYFPK